MLGKSRARDGSVLGLGVCLAVMAGGCAHQRWAKAGQGVGSSVKVVMLQRDDAGKCVALYDNPHIKKSLGQRITWILNGEPVGSILEVHFPDPQKPFPDLKCSGDEICRSGALAEGSGPPKPGDPAIPYPYECTIRPPAAHAAKGDPTIMVDF